MAKFPTIEEMARDVAEKALDEYEYKGKTLREWVKIILDTDTNVATKVGTNLAEVGTDCISREQAINALSTITMYKGSIPFDTAVMRIEQLPSAQPKWMKAKWKPVEVDSDDNVWLWECENCHEETEFKWDFCPVCGCEMTNATKVNG